MKQLYLSGCFFLALFAASCSSDDNNAVETQPVEIPTLIKKLSITTYNDFDVPTSYDIDFNYENGILKSLVQGNVKRDFLYDGDKITSVKTFTDGVQDDLATFVYQGDLLEQITSNALYAAKVKFLYANGVLSTRYMFYKTASEPVHYQTDSYTFFDGNFVENYTETDLPGQSSEIRNVFAYDLKNNPFKNMNKYFRLYFQNAEINCLSQNNPWSFQYFSPPSDSNPYGDYSYEMVYNSDDFPTEIEKRAAPDNQLVSVIRIQYN